MIIKQKLNHGGSRDLFIRPVDGGEAINLTAKWDLEPRRRAMVARQPVHLLQRRDRRRDPSVPRVGAGRRRRAGHQRTAAPGRVTIDKTFTTIAYTVGVHDAPPDVFVANIDGTSERRLSDVHARHHLGGRVQQDRAAAMAEQGRHADRRLADVPVRLRRREGAVSADRHQPRRAACGDRLQLRFQEAVLRRERLLRARHQLPQLDRLRRRVQVGDLGRVGQQGRRGRDLRASTTSSSATRSIRSASVTPATRTAGS